MYAGLSRLGLWVLGAALTALMALAHAQPAYAQHGGGGFGHAPAMRPMSGGGARGGWGMRNAGAAPARRESASNYGGYGGASGRYGAVPTRVADQGGWRERGGEGEAGGGNRAPERGSASNNPYGNGFGNYRNGPITPVSAQTREVPHPPADSPVRAGSIREDVARYNEERGSFRTFPRSGGEIPRPPMPSPYRN